MELNITDEKVVSARLSMEKSLRKSGYSKETVEACEAGGWKIKSYSNGDDRLSYFLVVYRDKVAHYHFALEDYYHKENSRGNPTSEELAKVKMASRSKFLVDELEMNLLQYREREKEQKEKELFLIKQRKIVEDEVQVLQQQKEVLLNANILMTEQTTRLGDRVAQLQKDHSYCQDYYNVTSVQLREMPHLKSVEKKWNELRVQTEKKVDADVAIVLTPDLRECAFCHRLQLQACYLPEVWSSAKRKCLECRRLKQVKAKERRNRKFRQARKDRKAKKQGYQPDHQVWKVKSQFVDGKIQSVGNPGILHARAVEEHLNLANLKVGKPIVIALLNLKWVRKFEMVLKGAVKHDCGGEFLCQYCQYVDAHGEPPSTDGFERRDFECLSELACVKVDRFGEVISVQNFVVGVPGEERAELLRKVQAEYTYSLTEEMDYGDVIGYFDTLSRSVDAYLTYGLSDLLYILTAIGVRLIRPHFDIQLLMELSPCAGNARVSLEDSSGYYGHTTKYPGVAGNDVLLSAFVYESLIQEFPFSGLK